MILLLETCTERAIVAIIQGDSLQFYEEMPFGYHHSRYLVSSIQKGLESLHLKVQELDAIATGTGPGSYTGMRVGAMTAKMLSFSTGVPLIGLCTLHCFSPQRTKDPFVAIIDAKIGGVYVSKSKAHEMTPPAIISGEELGIYAQGISHFLTPNASSLKEKMSKTQISFLHEINWEETAPDPRQMGILALESLRLGQYTQDGQLSLHYLQQKTFSW